MGANTNISIANLNSLKKSADQLIALRSIMHTPLWQIIKDYFISTREFEFGLDFFKICNKIIKDNEEQITDEENITWKINLIELRLEMLDRLNDWDEYISYFDSYIDNKTYTMKYAKPKSKPVSIKNPLLETSTPVLVENELDPRFGIFLVSEDENIKYVNFLFLHNSRYEVIKRKLDRQKKNKKVEHLKRHQSATLSDEAFNERTHVFLNKLEQYIREYQN